MIAGDVRTARTLIGRTLNILNADCDIVNLLSQQQEETMIDRAIALYQRRELAAAAQVLSSVLAEQPDHALALYYLAFVHHGLGMKEDVIPLLQQAIALAPSAAWYCDLGRLHGARLELEEAVAAFHHALELDANIADAWNSLGMILEALGNDADAQICFESAITIDPEFIDALQNMGNLLLKLGRDEDAAPYCCRAFVLQPAEGQSPWERGIAFYNLGRLAEAAEVYRAWLAREPNGIARHMLAACGGAQTPMRAADDYVQQRFDDFAANFDVHLAKLAYAGPALLEVALQRCLGGQHLATGLDAGCGTGLCGPVIRSRVDRLVGVDLASRMLEQAERKGCYDALVKAELTAYMQESGEIFDLIVAADTLIYFGDLQPLLHAAHARLVPRGHLIFTVESLTDVDQFVLHPSGRYQHQPAYVTALMADIGYTDVAMEEAIIRHEFGVPVPGLIITART